MRFGLLYAAQRPFETRVDGNTLYKETLEENRSE